MMKLSAKSLKVTIVIDPAAIARVNVPNGAAKYPIQITAGGHVLQAELNAKSLRRAVTTINEAGIDGVAVIVQGKLEGSSIVEAGITAQPRTPKVAA